MCYLISTIFTSRKYYNEWIEGKTIDNIPVSLYKIVYNEINEGTVKTYGALAKKYNLPANKIKDIYHQKIKDNEEKLKNL